MPQNKAEYQYRGDLMSTINEIVNVTNARYGIRLEPTIEQMCEILADVDPVHCEACERPDGLFPCTFCKAFYCSTCRPDHPCNQPDGPNLYDVTRG